MDHPGLLQKRSRKQNVRFLCQGFREGSTAMWGDRINMQMLRRLEELYPNQDDFRQGYVDGYKEGLHSRDVSQSFLRRCENYITTSFVCP